MLTSKHQEVSAHQLLCSSLQHQSDLKDASLKPINIAVDRSAVRQVFKAAITNRLHCTCDMKRNLNDASSPAEPANKKARDLGSWISIPSPKAPSISGISPPLTDRQSTFIAFAAPVTSQHGATQFQTYIRALRNTSHPDAADHEMMAYRIVGLKVGKSGLSGADDWTVKTGSDDDGEKNGGNTIRKCLEVLAAVDVVVVVSRYYGGVMLGPDRFEHIRKVATQAIDKLNAAIAIPPLIDRLTSLDAEIALLAPSSASNKTPQLSYTGLDESKARRLIGARQLRLKLLIEKTKEPIHLNGAATSDQTNDTKHPVLDENESDKEADQKLAFEKDKEEATVVLAKLEKAHKFDR